MAARLLTLTAFSMAIDGANGFINVMKSGLTWITEHTSLIKSFGVAVGIGAVGWAAYTVAVNGATWATQVYTGAQQLLNIVMSANPFGLIVVGLVAVAGAFYYAYENSEKFRGGVMGMWEASKTVFQNIAKAAVDHFGGLGDIIRGVSTLDPELIQKGFVRTIDGLKGLTVDIGKGVGESFDKGFAEGSRPN